MDLPGPSNATSLEAVVKHRHVATKCIKLKCPSAQITDELLRKTSTFDMKIEKYDDNIYKTGDLPESEVSLT